MMDKQVNKMLDSMMIVVDSREKKNDHILDFLKKYNIQYKIDKVESGDYTFELNDERYKELNRRIVVERKNSWDEIAGNLFKNRDRFAREFERVEKGNIHIVIENATWLKLFNGTYRSKVPQKAFLASILTWNVRYKAPVWLCQKRESPILIYNILRYGLRELILDLEKSVD